MSKNQENGQYGNYENVNWIKTKMIIVIFFTKTHKTGRGLEGGAVGAGFVILERERAPSF